MGSKNRRGKDHIGHYDPWLSQHINDVKIELGLQLSDDQIGIHGHAISFRSSNEKFGIAVIPEEARILYAMEPRPTTTALDATNFELSQQVCL